MCCATPQGGGGSTTHWTINTSPVSNWFPSDLFANANLLFMFLFLFTLYSHHEFNGCPWAAVAPSLLSFWFPSPSARRCERVFSFTQAPLTTPLFAHTQSGNSSAIFLQYFHLASFLGFSLFAFCFLLFPLGIFFGFCTFFFLSFFRYPAKHTIIISILMLQ